MSTAPEFNKTSRKYQIIFDSAKHLFNKHGILRVTVEQICKEANVSKMTFYKIFPNKLAAAEKILEVISNQYRFEYRAIMGQVTSFQLKIRQIVMLNVETSKEFSYEFLVDVMSLKNSNLHNFFIKLQQENREMRLKYFIEAQTTGNVREDIKPEFLMYLLNDLTEKIRDKKLTSMYDTQEEAIWALTSHFYYGIMKTEPILAETFYSKL
jgi:AcrR family transcriptional regulator